jgi:phospholipase C
MRRSLFAVGVTVLLGCGSSDGANGGSWAGGNASGDDGNGDAGATSGAIESAPGVRDAGGTTSGGDDGGAGAGTGDDGGERAPSGSKITHVVILIQENHTFDAYFGRYCTAPTGSEPTCNAGPSCCEAAPDKDPSGASPVTLDDTENAAYDPNHTQACELGEMNGGAMDKYTSGTSCSDPRNFALATTEVKPYWDYATKYAIADRYFQPIVGQSSSNDMYLAAADYVFTDNAYEPDSNGHGCSLTRTTMTYDGKTTIGDVLTGAGRSFAFYAEGYQAMLDATLCPLPPADCPAHVPTAPCDYDPGDVPFEYYAQFKDNPAYMKDFGQLSKDVVNGTLPDVVYVKALQYKNEHPGYGTTISAGVKLMSNVIDSILASPYGKDTLILLTWDEGGGLFDHVKPPGTSPADDQPYGTRIPLLALGPFAKSGYVSHVVMEHSSVVKFLEWNFTGVANLGDLIDATKAGIAVPAD